MDISVGRPMEILSLRDYLGQTCQDLGMYNLLQSRVGVLYTAIGDPTEEVC